MNASAWVPLRTYSALNQREHHMARARRVKQERMLGRQFCPRGLVLPLTITLTRIAPRALDSHDNLASSFKALVDGVCDRLGVKDNDPRLTWRYAQRNGGAKVYAVEMEFVETEQEATA